MLPAGLISGVVRESAFILLENNSLKAGVGQIHSGVYFSSTNPGFGGSAGGPGGSAGGPGGSIESSSQLRDRAIRELQEQHAIYLANVQAEEMTRREGQRFVDNYEARQNRLEAQLEPDRLDEEARIRAYQTFRNRAPVAQDRSQHVANRARLNSASLQSLSANFDPNIVVPDVNGIGVRGYVHGGINQPFAQEVASELERQDVSGGFSVPNMDLTANRFLATALVHLRPEVYGPNPTVSGANSMITRTIIHKLRNMP